MTHEQIIKDTFYIPGDYEYGCLLVDIFPGNSIWFADLIIHCVECYTPFEKKRNKKYCSLECRQKASARLRPLTKSYQLRRAKMVADYAELKKDPIRYAQYRAKKTRYQRLRRIFIRSKKK